MTPGRLDLEVPRNGSDARLLQLLAPDDTSFEEPIDVTGCSFTAQARDIFGGAVIASAAVTIDNASEGLVSVRWQGSQFDSFGDAMALATASWDLKMVDASNVPTVVLRGLIYITPEATA